jgi:hypothetical protein
LRVRLRELPAAPSRPSTARRNIRAYRKLTISDLHRCMSPATTKVHRGTTRTTCSEEPHGGVQVCAVADTSGRRPGKLRACRPEGGRGGRSVGAHQGRTPPGPRRDHTNYAGAQILDALLAAPR